MTDRIFAYTVVLEKEIRDDDAEAIKNAILMIRGVADVTEHVSNPEIHYAEERIRQEWGKKLWDILYPRSEE